MIKLLKVTKTTWIAFFIALFASFMITSVSHAQTASPSAQTPDTASKYGVTFPVAALGNCSDLNSCKTFCDDPINRDSCIAFAKSKGFYKEDALATQKDTILAKAKTALGCDSETSCLNLCTIPANQDKCSSFAQSTNLQGGFVASPDNQAIVNRAKDVLGCSSETACKSFCEQDANRIKCADFAHQVGLRGGEQKIGPGGCTSEQTCKAFCSNPDNFQICSGFTQSSGGNFSGPGGCNSPESCKSYCQQNPQSCSGFGGPGQNPQNGFNPAEMCNRTPNCSWTGSTCFCGNSDNNPTSSPNPAGMCGRYGCTWTGNSCQCTNISNSYNTSVYPDNNMSYSQQETSCKAGGGVCSSGSTSTFCNCQGYHSPQYSPNPSSGTYPAASSYNNSPYYCSNTCGSGYAPDPSQKCACVSSPTTGSCQPPSGGCGSNSYYDYGRCGCYQNGSTPNSPSSPGGGSCQPPSGGCGTNSYYDYSRCGCYQNGQSSGSTNPQPGSLCQPPSGGCGSNSYYDYGRCGCYQNGSTPATPPTSGSCPAGQYWNGSGCLNSNTGPQNSTSPTSTSQPAPAQTNAPQSPTTSSTSTPPPSTPQPSPAVKGISTENNIWTWLTNIFSK